MRDIPANWNRADVKETRRAFAQWLMEEANHEQLIFIDECGANVWTARTFGRAPRGVRAVRIVNNQRGQNLTTCLAVSPSWGLVHYKIIRGGMTSAIFEEFLIELREVLNHQPCTIVFDNARPHLAAVENVVMDDNQLLKTLPKYSPVFNPTENAISCLKATLKRSMSSPAIQQELRDEHVARQMGLTLHQHRCNVLTREMTTSLETITRDKCRQWFNHCMRFVPAALRMDDIVDDGIQQ